MSNKIDSMQEAWRPIPSWEGFYEVSSLGRVKSLRRTIRTKRGEREVRSCMRKLVATTKGYTGVVLLSPSRREWHSVHRLVLYAFVGPCPPGMECCHGDGIRSNNRLENLRWDTRKANAADVDRHGTRVILRGEDSRSPLTEAQAMSVLSRARSGERYANIAKDFGISVPAVSAIKVGRNWAHLQSEGAAR